MFGWLPWFQLWWGYVREGECNELALVRWGRLNHVSDSLDLFQQFCVSCLTEALCWICLRASVIIVTKWLLGFDLFDREYNQYGLVLVQTTNASTIWVRRMIDESTDVRFFLCSYTNGVICPHTQNYFKVAITFFSRRSNLAKGP